MRQNSVQLFFHVDLDAFFASVEMIDDPSLRGKPVIVGALPGHRGVVATCSYEARTCGIRSAMPISEAFRLCPSGVFTRPRMDRYSELSREVMGIFGEFTPDVTVVSIDEAFLTMTGTGRLWGCPADSAAELKSRVVSRTGLTVSVGVASNRYVAKTASGLSKPDGLTIVPEGGESDFMAAIPIARLWGAGEKTQERFRELGIDSIPKLRELGESLLVSIFGKSGGEFLYKASRGIDPGIYAGEAGSKSISTETTFERDVTDRETLESVLRGMADELAYRAYRENVRSRTCVLKLRTDDFSTSGRRVTARDYLLASDEIYEVALSLLDRRNDNLPVRLIGLGLVNLERGGAFQGELFGEDRTRRTKFERAVFGIQEKGIGKVTRARFIAGPADEER
ncbi:MAG: DNA polymerase IV [Spirochaetes bacterium]|nr:DNA polymerase IV [Spirochaetota bacterium]